MEKELMVSIIKGINSKGWSPATSTNYSFRTADENQTFTISKSGKDKQNFTIEDFMEVGLNGEPTTEFENEKSSAETLIHCFIYKKFPSTKCILHTHSLPSNILPVIRSNYKQIVFEGYEIIKGIKGQNSHNTAIHLPVFDNTQDMPELCGNLNERLTELTNFGFLIFKHGIYAWGDTIFEAKRHLETWEFLLEAELTISKKQ